MGSRGRQDLGVWTSEIWAGDKNCESSSQRECRAVNEYANDVRSVSVFRKFNETVVCVLHRRHTWLAVLAHCKCSDGSAGSVPSAQGGKA